MKIRPVGAELLHSDVTKLFISVFNQLDAQNLFHNKFYLQFRPPVDEHMCSKHVEA